MVRDFFDSTLHIYSNITSIFDMHILQTALGTMDDNMARPLKRTLCSVTSWWKANQSFPVGDRRTSSANHHDADSNLLDGQVMSGKICLYEFD